MPDNGHPEDAGPNPNPCPRCGQPMTSAAIIGPLTAYASPCGCEIAPESVIDGEPVPESSIPVPDCE